MDESEYGLLYSINQNVLASAKIFEKINENLEKLISTLECFGDFKP